MSSKRTRVARMDWCASRSTTSVMPSGCLAMVMEGTPFPESTASRAVLMNRGLDGCKNIRICFSARNLSGRYSRLRLSDDAAGEVGPQAHAEDKQNRHEERREGKEEF